MTLEGYRGYRKELVERYTRMGWWPGITIGGMLDRAAEQFPDKEALVDDRHRMTYGELKERTDRLAVAMMEMGIRKGDVALLQLPNWAEWVYSYFALQKIGAIVVLLVAGYTQRELNHFARLTGASTWVVPFRHRKMDYLPIIEDIRKENESLRHLITVRAPQIDGFSSLETLLGRDPLGGKERRALLERSPQPTDIAHVLPSGGTTGLPKLAPRTHNDYLCGVKYKAEACVRSSEEVCLTFTPIGHNLALQITICCTVWTGAKMVLLDSTKAEDFCDVVARERVTFAALVPALLRRLTQFERLSEYDLSSLQTIHVGAQHSAPDLIRSAFDRIRVPHVISAFGMVEGPNCNTRLEDEREIICNTVGRPCCPHDVLKTLDEDGRDLPPNHEGELAVKGPSVFAGYLKTDNDLVFTKDGFVRCGDLAVIDERGMVRITGRIKDIIIRGGENISAAEVEDLISKHPHVQDVAVVGMPDEDLGERVCAYIQPSPGVDLGFEQIIDFLKSEGISRHMHPERIEWIQAMPLTQAGKSDKKILREDIRSRLMKEKAQG